ncbi:major facilitator superfamily domain-containing protein 9-like [Anthonomus grandis grandis]|uniref:major facilitator superfamily domain-containing protein 9-like n=1 Tax=Anthonomus grandis grandis TaxID=2921223 RepID=UPI0021657E59|nr:major facilitator superfamily domain-containing protein 9-like [Anthonomus grandis grandis]
MIWLYTLFALEILNIAVFLPVFGAFARSLGVTPSTLSFIDSSCALISLLWNPVIGSLSDQIGRKGLLIKCLAASVIGSIIMAVSPSLPVAFVGRLIGAFGGSVGILLRSIVGDIYESPDDKKTFFSRCAPFISVGFLVGALSGGFLSEAQHGYRLSFLLMASVMGTAAILAQCFIPDDTKSISKKSSKNKKNQSLLKTGLNELKNASADLKSLSWSKYKNIFIIKASYDFATSLIMTNVGLILLNEYEIQGRYLGYTFLLISVISIIANILHLRLKSMFDNISDYDILMKGGFAIIITFIGMSIPSSVFVFLFFLAGMFMVKVFVDTTLVQMITTNTEENDRGKVIGAFENLVPLSRFFAPLVCGLLTGICGHRLLILSASMPLIYSIIIAKSKIE